MIISFYLLLSIFSIVANANEIEHHKPSVLGQKNDKCSFIGCSCNKNIIECPSVDSQDNYKLTMFPKRYNEKIYSNNLTLKLNNNLLGKF